MLYLKLINLVLFSCFFSSLVLRLFNKKKIIFNSRKLVSYYWYSQVMVLFFKFKVSVYYLFFWVIIGEIEIFIYEII